MSRPSATSIDQSLYDVIRQVRPLYRHLLAVVEDNLDGTGITVPLRGLLEVLREEGPRTTPQLARLLLIGRQFALRLVDAGIELGLLETRPNPAHQRSALIALSRDGEKQIDAILAREQRVIHTIAKPLAHAEVESCLQVISYLTRAFAEVADTSSEEKRSHVAAKRR